MVPAIIPAIADTLKKRGKRRQNFLPTQSTGSIYIRVHTDNLFPIPTALTDPLTTGPTTGPIAGPSADPSADPSAGPIAGLSASPITGPSTGVTRLMTSSSPPTIAPTKGPSPLTSGLSIPTTDPNLNFPATDPSIPAISLHTGTSSSPQSPHPAHRQLRHLYLIEGTFKDIERYAGTTVDWVIKVAHFICSPSQAGAGQVFTHTKGSIAEWLVVDRDSSWREVALGDTLHPGIYEFVLDTGPIELSKICLHTRHSQTSLGTETQHNATYFCAQIQQRDGNKCVVSQMTGRRSLTATHLIPKRLGTDGARAIVTRFCGEQAVHDINRFDPRIGILLIKTVDGMVDMFELGFYSASDTMVSHHIKLSIVYI
jgi:hypothetical protein